MRIELKNVRKSFDGKVDVIKNLNMTIEDGEFIALLGPSGCGKSTTMLMLTGIYKPTSGEIYFDGQLVNEVEPKDRQIGMLFQSYALYPHMTVLNNITFPLKQMKVPKKERIERAKEAAAMVQLEDLLHRKPSELSGGQQQRVALARAIVKEPKLLLLDEPLSNLDTRLKIEMREEIARLQKKLGITTIMVTHDQEEAMSMADRVAVMKDGDLVQFSSPVELYSHPTNYFVGHFIGSPPMNFFDGTIKYENQQWIFHLADHQVGLKIANDAFALETNEYEVKLGIRPHDITLDTQTPRLKGTVRQVEPMGYNNLITLEIGDTRCRFFVDKTIIPKIGDELGINFDDRFIQLFDAGNLRSLRKTLILNEKISV